MIKKLNLLLFAILANFFLACEKEEDPVVISSFEPLSGDYGTEVTIKGAQFGLDASSNIVKFGTQRADVISASTTELVARVPVGSSSGKISVESNGKIAQSNENFTVTAGSWAPKARFGTSVFGSDMSFNVGDKGYVHISYREVSGTPVNAALWQYNPSSDTWTQKKELSPKQNAVSAKWFGTSTRGYILQYQKLWEYNQDADEWTLKNPLPIIFSTTEIMNTFYIKSVDRVYAIMGNGYFLEYNPQTDVWSQTPETPFASSLNYNSNRIAQGTDTKGYFKLNSDVWQFDPSTGQWSKLPSFPDDVDCNFSFGIDNDLYIGTSSSANFWVYKPSTNKWVQKASLAQQRIQPVYFTLGNKGYLGLGLGASDQLPLLDLNEFNP